MNEQNVEMNFNSLDQRAHIHNPGRPQHKTRLPPITKCLTDNSTGRSLKSKETEEPKPGAKFSQRATAADCSGFVARD